VRRKLEAAGRGGLNEATASAWLRDFDRSAASFDLDPTARRTLEGAVRVLARRFTSRWHGATETRYLLSEMTSEDATYLLTEQLPSKVGALDSALLVDVLIGFLVWAAKAGKIEDRSVEYACRKVRHVAIAAMMDERKWDPGKAIMMDAIRDGVDPSDLAQVREHAIRTSLDPSFVDEFLPSGPVLLANGEWLGLPD
jgi:hypothetical protein